ncbi:MAG: putative periplasmic protein [Proteobacteria bacterium]|nr:putative periplasmic protein [Pseudomonadota bacterium]
MKRILSYLGVALLFLLMQGCASRTPPPSTVTTYANEKNTTNPKLSKLVGKNYIKGVVISLKQDANSQLWNYEIDGIETTNGKLPYVNFNHKTVLANEGDLVYASFDGMRMTEMFVVKEGYLKGGKRASPTPPIARKKSTGNNAEASAGKRDKAHQVIGVPQEETVRF